MDLLFVTFWSFDGAESNGITKKILAQIAAFRDAGFNVDHTCCLNGRFLLYRRGEPVDLCATRPLTTRIAASNALRRYLAREGIRYDRVYVRYPQGDPALAALLRSLHRNGRVIVEIPTFPYNREFMGSFPLRCSLLLDRLSRKSVARETDRFLTFSQDDTIFGVPTIRTDNGIDTSACPLRRPLPPDGRVHVLAVAGFSPWHGYDRLLKGLAAYRADAGQCRFVLDFAGDGPSLQGYRDLAQALGLSGDVVFHGPLHGDALNALFDRADVAAASLGIHRLGLPYSTSLKYYEYLVRGLPAITIGRRSDAPGLVPYRLRVPSSDDPVDFHLVEAFAEAVYAGRSRTEVAELIRNAAVPLCSMSAVMRPAITFFRTEDAL